MYVAVCLLNLKALEQLVLSCGALIVWLWTGEPGTNFEFVVVVL